MVKEKNTLGVVKVIIQQLKIFNMSYSKNQWVHKKNDYLWKPLFSNIDPVIWERNQRMWEMGNSLRKDIEHQRRYNEIEFKTNFFIRGHNPHNEKLKDISYLEIVE